MDVTFRQFAGAVRWLVATGLAIFRRRPRALTSATATMGAVRVARTLALMLPFKVIMLAGSSGVPHYAPFIALEDKNQWIAGLAAAAIIAYVLSHVLASVATRIADTAGNEIADESTHLQAVANQRDHARSIFHSLAIVASAGIFWVLCIAVLALLDRRLALVYLALAAVSFILAATFTIAPLKRVMRRAQAYVVDQTSSYVSYNGSILFFSLFFVILYPFLVGETVNMLIAIASFILTRQSITALSDLVLEATRLVRRRHLVDALMFRDRQLVVRPSAHRQSFAAAFGAEGRHQLVSDMLKDAGHDGEVDEVAWRDPVVGLPFFSIGVSDGRRLHLQVFPKSKLHLMKNEDVLFSHVSRAQVLAPDLLAVEKFDDYTCRLLDIGRLQGSSGELWSENGADELVAIAGVRPPESLVDAYSATHLLLHQSLTTAFLSPASVAINSPARAATFQAINDDLPQIRRTLKKLPLTIANPDLNAHCAVPVEGRSFLFPYWGRWLLAPLGGGVLAGLDDAAMKSALARVRTMRSDVPAGVTARDMRLAALCQRLHAQVGSGAYGAALQIMEEIEQHMLARPRGNERKIERERRMASA